jgi:hypothetical protein
VEATGCRIVTYGREGAEFRIWAIADLHRFARGMALNQFYKDREDIKKDPYSLWVQPGDYCDWIVPGDKRFDPAAFDEKVTVNNLESFAAYCANQIVADFTPIKGKGLGFGIGNHDLKYLSRNSEMMIHTEICKKLGLPDLKYAGWFDIYFVYVRGSRVNVKIAPPPDHFEARLRVLCYHGIGAAATAGGKINALKKIVDMVDADLVITGHLHEEIAKKFVRLFPNERCDDVKSKITMGLISSSYLRTYAQDYVSYGELKGYAPTSLGASSARYRPDTKRLSVEIAGDNIGIGPV